MGAENSKNRPRNEITPAHLELALEKQRKLYESQTKALLKAQQEALRKSQEQSTSQLPTSSSAHNASAMTSIYPNLPTLPPPNAHARDGRYQYIQPTLPTAPTPANYSTVLYEAQTSACTPKMSFQFNNRPQPQSFKTHIFSTMQCPNSPDGCTLRLKESEIEEHLLECLFRDLTCPVNIIYKCAWKGKVTQLKSHFDEEHPESCQVKINKEDSLHIGENYQFLYLINLSEFNFLLHIMVQKHTKKITFGVQLIGTKKSASKWTYQLRIYNKNEPRRLFEYIDICQSDSVPYSQLMFEGKIASISLDYANTLSNQQEITYKLFLKKIVAQNNWNNIRPNKSFSQNSSNRFHRYQQKNN